MDFLKLLKEEREKAKRNLTSNSFVASIPKQEDAPTAEKSPQSPQTVSLRVDRIFTLPETSNFLENFRVSHIPSAFYIPNAIYADAEQDMLRCVETCGEMGSWKVLTSRRLQLHGTIPQGISESCPLPDWLTSILSDSQLCRLYPEGWVPNNVLINQYDYDQGIMHHTDGPAYKDFVIILSLESTCVMTFKPKLSPSEIGIKSDAEVLSVCLEPRSIFIFTDELYSNHLHGISEESEVVLGNSCNCGNLQFVTKSIGEKILRRQRTSITIREAFPAK